jgi:hypothetical protein
VTQIRVIKVNGERYVSVEDMLKSVAQIRETSYTRKQALEYIVLNLKDCNEVKLTQTMRVDG